MGELRKEEEEEWMREGMGSDLREETEEQRVGTVEMGGCMHETLEKGMVEELGKWKEVQMMMMKLANA